MEAEVQTSFPENDKGHGGEGKSHRTFVTLEGFPRKKLSSASEAEKKFKRAILEASAELSHDFHTTYLDKIVTGSVGKGILDVEEPDTSYESLKKGFLFYLNGTGKYLVLREHLREVVVGLLHQKSIINHANGFKTKQQYQSFLHESYSDMLDYLNEAIHSTALEEAPGNRITKCVAKDKSKDVRRAKHLRDLYLFAQEAFAQSDFENAHRLHAERIARSGDSDDCWIDFAVMWLSRGDDRLAEITVREALTKNPNNLVGLLIAGLIAGRHRDELGISYLKTLLKHRPLCPEIHVLIAAVHSHMGNQTEAESYFESARKIHKVLTGPYGTTTGTESKDRKSAEDGLGKKKRQSEGSEEVGQGKKDGKRESLKSKKKSGKGTKSEPQGRKKESQLSALAEGDEGGGRRISRQSEGKKSAEVEIDARSEDPGIQITIENFGATKPPTLNSCLIVTWNVTKKAKEKLIPSESGDADNRYKPEKVDGETVEDVRHSFTTILEATAPSNESLPLSKPSNSDHQHHHHLHQHRHHKHHSGVDLQRYSIFEEPNDHVNETVTGPINDPAKFPGKDEQFTAESAVPELGKNGKAASVGGGGPPVYSQRFGSEFLWTAHLLLKLRQFEFLDLILAKEISTSPERSKEYLYLRAVSLHLRGRDTEALEVIGEELKRNPENCTFWVLQAHAYYNLRNKEGAIASYERAMMLPHGRESLHLAYIRFGALCIEKGDLQMAKRVFLKRAAIAPSPYLWIAIGNTCFALGELKDAVHAFSEGNKLDSTNPVIWAHLSLVSLTQGNRNLAEQSYKWAIRFGLKPGKLLDDIKGLHRKLGYGNPAFFKIPQCLPHEVFLQRLGRETPLELYAEALNFSHLKSQQRSSLENRDGEDELIGKLREKDRERLLQPNHGGAPGRTNEGRDMQRASLSSVGGKIRRGSSHVGLNIKNFNGKKSSAPKRGKKK